MCTQYLLEYMQNSRYSVLTQVLFLSTRFIPALLWSLYMAKFMLVIQCNASNAVNFDLTMHWISIQVIQNWWIKHYLELLEKSNALLMH